MVVVVFLSFLISLTLLQTAVGQASFKEVKREYNKAQPATPRKAEAALKLSEYFFSRDVLDSVKHYLHHSSVPMKAGGVCLPYVIFHRPRNES